jgi:hypothetical protein
MEVDLRRKRLSKEEIAWLANSFISGRWSAKELFDKYKIFGSRLHRYVQKTLKGEPIYTCPGQPRKLDEISLRALVNIVKDFLDISEDELRDHIRTEYRNFLRRKYPNEVECVLRRRRALSYKTVRYYSEKIRLTAQREQAGDSSR